MQYDQIPHYQCCSGSAMNPKVAKKWFLSLLRKAENGFMLKLEFSIRNEITAQPAVGTDLAFA